MRDTFREKYINYYMKNNIFYFVLQNFVCTTESNLILIVVSVTHYGN